MDPMIREVISRKKEGDPEVMAEIRECIHYLAIGIANMINNFNSRRVCLGNYLGMVLKGQEEELNEEVNRYLLPHYREERKIYISGLEEWGAALGAISTVRTCVFGQVNSG